MVKRFAPVVAAAFFFLGAIAPGAFASPNTSQYGNIMAQEHTTSPKAKPVAAAKLPTGTLPFTGLDIGIVAAGGLLALVGGYGLRRLGRTQNQKS